MEFGATLVQHVIESLLSTAELHSVQSCIHVTVLLEGFFDLCDARVLLHHQEIRFAVLVELTDPAEQEAGARVLIADNGDQFSAAGHHEAPQSQIFTTKRREKGC